MFEADSSQDKDFTVYNNKYGNNNDTVLSLLVSLHLTEKNV